MPVRLRQSWMACAMHGTRIIESRERIAPVERSVSCSARIKVSLFVALSVAMLKI